MNSNEQQLLHIRDMDEWEVVVIGKSITMYYGSFPFSHTAEATAEQVRSSAHPDAQVVVRRIPRAQGRVVRALARLMRRLTWRETVPVTDYAS